VHVSDRAWRPAAWLKATRALRPLAKHRSYSARIEVWKTVYTQQKCSKQ
jgi:hypothetical protein